MKNIAFKLGMILCAGFFCSAAAAQNPPQPGKSVGVLWVGRSEMTTRVMQGFQEQMQKMAPGLVIDDHRELSDGAAVLVYEQFQQTRDAIVFLRSPGAMYMVKNPPRIPAFVGGCNNPVAIGVGQSMSKPGGNITGVTYSLPFKKQLEMFLTVMPQIKTIGLLLEKGHPGSAIDLKETQDACAKLGLACMAAECIDKNDLVAQAKRLSKKVDVIVLGTQVLTIDNGSAVFDAVAGPDAQRKTPVVSYSEKPIRSGAALCGLVADDVKLGRMLADSVIGVLNGGQKPGDIPIKTDPAPKFLLNTTVARKLGLTLPEAITDSAIKVE